MLNPIALLKGKIITIEEVLEKDEFICPSCQGVMGVKGLQENKVRKHFFHIGKKGVEKDKICLETNLHLFAKEVLAMNNRLLLPPVYYVEKEIHSNVFIAFDEYYSLTDYHYLNYDPKKVKVEYYEDGIKPDVFIEINHRKLYIEVYVTHKIDEAKKDKIADREINCLEVDLSCLEKKKFDKRVVEELILNGEKSKYNDSYSTKREWVYYKKSNEFERKIKEWEEDNNKREEARKKMEKERNRLADEDLARRKVEDEEHFERFWKRMGK